MELHCHTVTNKVVSPYADTLLIVAEPTWKASLTARRLADFARQRKTRPITVASKVKDEADVDRVQQMLGEPVAAAVPSDEAVAACDRIGVGLIDHAPSSPAVRAIEDLVEGLVRETLAPVASR